MSQDQIQIFYVPSGFEPNILSLSYKLHGAEFPNDQDKKYVDILSDKKLLAAGRIIAVNKNGKSMLGEVSESTMVVLTGREVCNFNNFLSLSCPE